MELGAVFYLDDINIAGDSSGQERFSAGSGVTVCGGFPFQEVVFERQGLVRLTNSGPSNLPTRIILISGVF